MKAAGELAPKAQPAVPSARIGAGRVHSLPRDRLFARLGEIWDHRLGLVVGQAGSGKTTLLRQFARRVDAPIAWHTIDPVDREEQAFLGRLRQALCVVGGGDHGWLQLIESSQRRDGIGKTRTILVLDDFHVIHDSPAEGVIERLLGDRPSTLRVLISSRSPPGFDISRLRVSGELLEVGPDDLRFRSWEVERLFRDVYEEPLPPEDFAELTRRTEGWAAGLQLFHLATRDKSQRERHQTLAAMGLPSRLVGEYLTRNVLDGLDPGLRDFLIGTSVLGRLSGALCDRLLRRRGSLRVLESLEREQVFTHALDEPGQFRYHEVLRAHLESLLVEKVGEAEAQRYYVRAGTLLESAGALPEALRAYCRGEAWEAAARLLGRGDDWLVEVPATWSDVVSAPILDHDPWLLLARARRHRATGRIEKALEAYLEAEPAFSSSAAAELCWRERLAIVAWLDPLVVPPGDWSGSLRSATTREPMAVRRATRLPGPRGQVVRGTAALLAGYLDDAMALLGHAAQSSEGSDALALGARLGHAIARLFSGHPDGAVDAELAAEEAERLGLTWFSRMARAALALSDRPEGPSEAAWVRLACESEGDRWGSALSALFAGWGALKQGRRATALLEEAVAGFRWLGAGTLEAWARAAMALAMARTGEVEARQMALQAEVFARSVGARAAQGVAYMALWELDPARDSEYRALALEVRDECSLALPGDDPGVEAEPSVMLRSFGGFAISINGWEVDLSGVRPRARQVLHLLALHVNRPIHREVLIEALWPEGDTEAGTRNLHVAISTLRHLLDPVVLRRSGSVIVREGSTYQLALPPGARVDVSDFDLAISEARGAQRMGDEEACLGALGRALDLYAGDMLPEEGPAEWVIKEREQRRADACEAAQAAAEMLLRRGEPTGAANLCERALRLDPYRDELWRLCMTAYERAGHIAAGIRTKLAYQKVLAELGVTSPLSS